MSLALLLLIGLAVIWSFVVGEFSMGQFVIGLLFGAVFVLATRAGRGRTVAPHELPRRLAALVAWSAFVGWQVLRSSVGVARLVLRRRVHMRPAIIRIQLGDMGVTGIALEEHAITLAPGQIVVDYAEGDIRTIYLHTLDIDETERELPSVRRMHRHLLARILS